MLISNETSGGWTVTYQTVVIRVYSERGVLISIKKEGPTLISKVKAGDNNPNAPDPNKLSNTLGEELVRVNTGITYMNRTGTGSVERT
ncbi:MAG: hypothetical protein LBI03_08435 [Clostridiales bacterium]|jgi:hypothetical protein|nr:hypothetical protein [Clostridiales bacterium]